jgi:1-acyl-sn-glycerol-3-phosphate acyltransferase
MKLEIEGMENVPSTGPALLLVSHTNFLDPFLACGLVPRMVVPMGKAEVFQIPLFGWLLRRYGACPVRRGEVDVRALRCSLRALQEGHVLLIAPEGTRSGDGRLQPGKHGTAYVATRMDVPLVPMAIIGGESFYSCLSRLQRVPVRINLGRAFRLRRPGGVVRRKMLHQMTEEVMYRMARLLPPERRGVYSDLSRATEEYIVYEPADTELDSGGMERVTPATRR